MKSVFRSRFRSPSTAQQDYSPPPPQTGNRAYNCGRHQEALEQYGAALAMLAPLVAPPTTPSHGSLLELSAVLHCNQAAAFHNLGRYLEAIAVRGR